LLDARRRAPEAAVAVAGFQAAEPGAYGRLVLDRGGGLARIVEAKDAGPEELAIRLCNGGIMAIAARHAFDLIDQIGDDNAKREFYLTDIVGIAKRRGLVCRVVESPALGVRHKYGRPRRSQSPMMRHTARRCDRPGRGAR